MRKFGVLAAVVSRFTAVLPASAKIEKFRRVSDIETIKTDGATIHVRVGGKGPAVVLLHGFGDTGDMWAPLANALIKDHTVIVPDLRGMGLSSYPSRRLRQENAGRGHRGRDGQARTSRQADLVTHDIGNMVGYAFAAQYPDRITSWAIIDAPLPGIGPWDEILKSPLLWHFNFRGPDIERLVEGRERIYLDRFWNEFSADPKAIDEETRRHYAKLYARPGAMHAASSSSRPSTQGRAPTTGRSWRRASSRCRSSRSAREKSFGTTQAVVMREVASNVEGGHHHEFRPLDHGRAAGPDGQKVKAFLEKK